MVKNLWDDKATFESELEDLVYRSNLFGQDRSIANWGGGNTSTKSIEKDFRGRDVEVMWVKGSGSDLATMTGKNFTGLRMEDIRDRKSTRLNSSHVAISYAVFCLKKKN